MAGGQGTPGTQGGASGPGPDHKATDESTRTPSMKRGPQPTGTTPEPPKPQAPNPPTPEQGSHSSTTSGPATTRKGNPSAQEAQQAPKKGNAGQANASCEPDGPSDHGEGTSGQGSRGGRSRDPSAEWQQAGRRSRANRASNQGQGSNNRGKPGKSSGPPRKPKPTGDAKDDAGKGPKPSKPRSGNTQSKRKANSNTSSGAHPNTSQGTHSNKSFKIPKKSYSAAAGASSSSNTATDAPQAPDVEIGDLSLEEEASLHAESFKGMNHISVYIHTSRERRLKITRDQFNFVWKTLQDLIFAALESGQEVPPPHSSLLWGKRGPRGH